MAGGFKDDAKKVAQKKTASLYAEFEKDINVRLRPLNDLGVRNKEQEEQRQLLFAELQSLQQQQEDIVNIIGDATDKSLPVDEGEITTIFNGQGAGDAFYGLAAYVRLNYKNQDVCQEKLQRLEEYKKNLDDFSLRDTIARYESLRGNLPNSYAYNITKENNELYKALSEISDHKIRRSMLSLLSGNRLRNNYKGSDAAIAKELEKLTSLSDRTPEQEKQIAALNVIREQNKQDREAQIRIWSAKYDAIRHHKSGAENYKEFFDEKYLKENELYQLLMDGPDIDIPGFFDVIFNNTQTGIHPYEEVKDDLLKVIAGPNPSEAVLTFAKNIKKELTKEPLDPLAVEASKFLANLPAYAKLSPDDICIDLVAGKDKFFNILTEKITKNGEQGLINLFKSLSQVYADAEETQYSAFTQIPATFQILKNFVKNPSSYSNDAKQFEAGKKQTEEDKQAAQLEFDQKLEQEYLNIFCIDESMKEVVSLGTDMKGSNRIEALTNIFKQENKIFNWIKTVDDVKEAIQYELRNDISEEIKGLIPQKDKSFDAIYSAFYTFAGNYPQYCEELPDMLEALWEQYPDDQKAAIEQYKFTTIKGMVNFYSGIERAKQDIIAKLSDDNQKKLVEQKLTVGNSFGEMYNNISELLRSYPKECKDLPELLQDAWEYFPEGRKLSKAIYAFDAQSMQRGTVSTEYIPPIDQDLPYYRLYLLETEMVRFSSKEEDRKELMRLMPGEGDSFADIYVKACRIVQKFPRISDVLPEELKTLWGNLPEEGKLAAENYDFTLEGMRQRNIPSADISRPDPDLPYYALYCAEIEILKTVTDNNIQNIVIGLMPQKDDFFDDVYEKTCSLIQLYTDLSKNLPNALSAVYFLYPHNRKGNYEAYKFEMEEIIEAGKVDGQIEAVEPEKPYYALYEAEREIFNNLGMENVQLKRDIKLRLPQDGESFGDIYNTACELIKKYPPEQHPGLFDNIPKALTDVWNAFPDNRKAPLENYDLTLDKMVGRDTSYELLLGDDGAPYQELFLAEYEIIKSVGSQAVREKIQTRMPKYGDSFDDIFYNASIIFSDNERYCSQLPKVLEETWKKFPDDKKKEFAAYDFTPEGLKDAYIKMEKFPEMAADAPVFELYQLEQNMYHDIKDADLRETIKKSMPNAEDSFEQVYQKTCALIRKDRERFKDFPGMLKKAWMLFSYENKEELSAYDFSLEGILNPAEIQNEAQQNEFDQFDQRMEDNKPQKYEELLLEYVINARRFSDGDGRSREELKEEIIRGRDSVYNALYAASAESEEQKDKVITQLKNIRSQNKAAEFFDDIKYIAEISNGVYSDTFSRIKRIENSLFSARVSDSLKTNLKGIYSDGTEADSDFVNCNNRIASIDLIKAKRDSNHRYFSEDDLTILTQAVFIKMISNPAEVEYHKELSESEKIREDLKERFKLEARQEFNPNVPDDMFEVFAENMIQNDSSRSNNLLRMAVPAARTIVKGRLPESITAFADDLFFAVQKSCDYIAKSKKFTPGVFASAKIVFDTMKVIQSASYFEKKFTNKQMNYAQHVCKLYQTMKEVSDLEKQLSDRLVAGQLGQDTREEIKTAIADISARKCCIDEYLQQFSISDYLQSKDLPFDAQDIITDKYRNEYLEALKTTEKFKEYDTISSEVKDSGSMTQITAEYLAAQKQAIVHNALPLPMESQEIQMEMEKILDTFEESLSEYSDVRYVKGLLHECRNWVKSGISSIDIDNLDRHLNVIVGLRDVLADAGGASELWADMKKEIAQREGGVRQSNYNKKETIILKASEWSNTDVQMSKIKDVVKKKAVKSLNSLIEKLEAARPFLEKEAKDYVGVLKIMGHPMEGGYDGLKPLIKGRADTIAYYTADWKHENRKKIKSKADYSYNRVAPNFYPEVPAADKVNKDFNELVVLNNKELFSGVSRTSSFGKMGIKNLSDMKELYPDVLMLIEKDRKDEEEKKKEEAGEEPKEEKKEEVRKEPKQEKKEEVKEEPKQEKKEEPDIETLKNRCLGVAHALEQAAGKALLAAGQGAEIDSCGQLMLAAASLLREYAEFAEDKSASEKIAARLIDKNGRPNLEFAILRYALDVYNGKIEPAERTSSKNLLKIAVRYSQDALSGITDKNEIYKVLYNKLKNTRYMLDSDRRRAEKEEFKEKFDALKTGIAFYQKYWSLPMQSLAAQCIDEMSVAAYDLIDTPTTFNEFVSGKTAGKSRDLTVASRAMSHIYVLEQMFKNQTELQDLGAEELNRKVQEYRADYAKYLRDHFEDYPYEAEAEALDVLKKHLIDFSPKKQYDYDRDILDYALSRENKEVSRWAEIIKKADEKLVKEALTVNGLVQNGLKKVIVDDKALTDNTKVQALLKYFSEEPDVKELFDPAVYAEIEKKTNAIQEEQNALDAEAEEIKRQIGEINQELLAYEEQCGENGINGVDFRLIRAAINKNEKELFGNAENKDKYKRSAEFEKITLAADKYLKDRHLIIRKLIQCDEQIDACLQKKNSLAQKKKELSDFAEKKLKDVFRKQLDAEAQNEIYTAAVRDFTPQLSQGLKNDLVSVCKNLVGLKAGLKTIAKPGVVSAEAVLAEEALKAVTKIEEGLRQGKDAQQLLFDDKNMPIKELTLLLKCREVFSIKDGHQLGLKEDYPDKKLFDKLNQTAKTLNEDAKNYLAVEISHLLYDSTLDLRLHFTEETMNIADALADAFNELSTPANFESLYSSVVIGQALQQPLPAGAANNGFGEAFHSTQLFNHMPTVFERENKRTQTSEKFTSYVKVLEALKNETEKLYFDNKENRLIGREDIDKYELTLQGYSRQLKEFMKTDGLYEGEDEYIAENNWLLQTYIENDTLLLGKLKNLLGDGEKATISDLIGKNMQPAGPNNVGSVTYQQMSEMQRRMNELDRAGHRNSGLYKNVSSALNKLLADSRADEKPEVMKQDCSELSRACKNYIEKRGKSEPSTQSGKDRLKFIKELYSVSAMLAEGWDMEDLKRQIARTMITSAGKTADNAAINKMLCTDLFRSIVGQKNREELRRVLYGEYTKGVMLFTGAAEKNKPQAEVQHAEAGDHIQDPENVLKEQFDSIDNIIADEAVHRNGIDFEDFHHSTQLKLNLEEVIVRAKAVGDNTPAFKDLIEKMEVMDKITKALYEKDGQSVLLQKADITKYITSLKGFASVIGGADKLKNLTQAEQNFLPEIKQLGLLAEQDLSLMKDIEKEIADNRRSIFHLINRHEEIQNSLPEEDNVYVIPDMIMNDNTLQEKLDIIRAANDAGHPQFTECVTALNDLNEITEWLYSKDEQSSEMLQVDSRTLSEYLHYYKTAYTAVKRYSDIIADGELKNTLNQVKTKLENESAVLGKIKLGNTERQTLPSLMQNIKDSDYELKRFKGLKQELINVDSMLHIDTSLYKAMDASLKTVIQDLESGSDPKKLQTDYASLLVNSRKYASERGKTPRKTDLEKGRFKVAKQLTELAAAFKEKVDIKLAEEKLAIRMLEYSGQAVFKEDHKTVDMEKKANVVAVQKIMRSHLFRIITENKTAAGLNKLADKKTIWAEIFQHRNQIQVQAGGNQAQQNQPQQANQQNQAQADVQQNQPQADANQNQQEQVQQNVLHN